MAKHQPKVLATSPLGTLAHAWIANPDKGYKDADADNPKYKSKVLIAKEGANLDGPVVRSKVDDKWSDVSLEGLATDHAAAVFGKAPKNLLLPCIKDGDEMAEDNPEKYESFAGHWVVEAKSKYQPKQYDAGKDELPANVFAGSGDLARISFSMYAYGEGAKRGVSLQLRTIQVIEKRAMAGGGSAEDFDDDMEDYEGGYKADAPVDDDDADSEY